MEEDWDLQAVVRGCCNTSPTTTSMATNIEDSFSFFSPLDLKQEDGLLCFPDLFETSTVIEELEQLYKPFFPNFPPISSQIIPTSIPPILPQQQHQQQQQQRQQQEQQQQPHRSLVGSVTATSTTHSQTPRPKRRKNQQKKVVCQVPAEGLSSDMWAWRKYGQKPIKGSPYPRGYYRCSSSKGCLARKQVERNRSDPTMFVVTYTAEHNHPVPTHRNSLAGSTRQKFSTPQRSTNTSHTDTQNNKATCSSSSPTSTTGLSPTTPLTSSMDDELLQQSKQESREDEEEEEIIEDEEDDLLISDAVMSDDLFMGLDELAGPTSVSSPFDASSLDDCLSDNFPTSFPASWFPNNNNAASAAAGGN